ncbi:MAG TPA: PEP-CTERM sorting domain-containing protein [Bryobacteraceae bacterium]|nr:PEP-CTERM sorting domain-containing protein [Bryobacteraceae bacterium]
MFCRPLGRVAAGIAFCLGGAMLVSADTVISGGSWQTWTAGFPGSTLGTTTAPTYGGGPATTTQGPYWNNASGDGPAANIGWCLAGGGDCTLFDGSPGAVPFYGGANGSAITNMSFSGDHSQITATLETSMTSQRANDTFGYYTFDPTTGTILQTVALLSASSAPGTQSATFVPSTPDYGFYIENTQGNPADPSTFPSEYFFYTDANLNNVLLTPNPTDHLQHLAIFNTGNTFYIGAVDTRACSADITSSCLNPADFDYQDMVVKLTVVTPEPASFALLGLSLGLLGMLLARARAADRV